MFPVVLKGETRENDDIVVDHKPKIVNSTRSAGWSVPPPSRKSVTKKVKIPATKTEASFEVLSIFPTKY